MALKNTHLNTTQLLVGKKKFRHTIFLVTNVSKNDQHKYEHSLSRLRLKVQDRMYVYQKKSAEFVLSLTKQKEP